jgi:dienelactone hydrolase
MITELKGRRKELYNLLGDLPESRRKIGASKIDEEERDNYILEKLVLDLNGIEDVPAYFTRPKGKQPPFATILYNHAHGGDYQLGKDELLNGRKLLGQPPYAEALARQGYAAICIDHWVFGERHGRTESATFKEMIWHGKVLWGMMVYDSIRAVDYLVSRKDVDKNRIGSLGLSMGSTMAWWLAALDTRIKVCVDICCLTDFHELIEHRGLDEHGIYYYVPSLLKHFTTTEINKLIVPRPHLSLAGIFDPLTPADGLEKIDKNLKKAYSAAKASDAWRMVRYRTGHFETADMRARIMAFLKKYL